jgi:NAD(P)H-dependent FMN reductase
MPLQMLVLNGSYRSVRRVEHTSEELRSRGDAAERIEARSVGLLIMHRMYKGYALSEARAQIEGLARKIRQADAFAFVVGEYNWRDQPGLKNRTEHFLEDWFWRPAVITSNSAVRIAGVRAALAWRGTL